MMRKLWLALVFVVASVATANAAGTIVPTGAPDTVEGQDVTIYTYTMTADASDGSFPATASYPINGWIIRVETNPGSTAPTANYDITLTDQDGLDVMGGVLANRSATATEHVLAPQPYVRGAVTITPTGNSVNSAVVVLRITVLR